MAAPQNVRILDGLGSGGISPTEQLLHCPNIFSQTLVWMFGAGIQLTPHTVVVVDRLELCSEVRDKLVPRLERGLETSPSFRGTCQGNGQNLLEQMEVRDAVNEPVNGEVVEKISDRSPGGLPGERWHIQLGQGGRGLRACKSVAHGSKKGKKSPGAKPGRSREEARGDPETMKQSCQTERRVGFWSEYTFKCNGCAENRKVTTDPVAEPTPLTDKTALGVNDAAVWGFMSIGSGHSHLEEAMSVMEIPTMSKGAFLRREESIDVEGTLIKEMTEAGEEEKMLAEAAGDFCEDGTTPWITVVVDGGWSHRSHGHRYSANSGVAVIVGKRTQKLLYLGVRNKLCSTCEYYAKKGERKEHSCYRNWDQSSGAMEADILVEGFQRSTEMHGVQYRTFIGDGDSSVYYQLQTRVDYGRFIKKNECANHVVKCYTSRLYSIAKESKGTRSLLSGPRMKRIKNGARKAVSHYPKFCAILKAASKTSTKKRQGLFKS
ncbi:hypothetical protein HPB52_021981 [Rhipicephalus sanguineus]|uniref:Mutator-like transposase domain-containing protein n=1 Tax=Rhipicephalus sanguineus TaxID=34632 RepID=A0A9D4PPA5_RHISA|nr:hypothetical protein HPB52_021981 [Rhipicephalus sanguineus]